MMLFSYFSITGQAVDAVVGYNDKEYGIRVWWHVRGKLIQENNSAETVNFSVYWFVQHKEIILRIINL